MSYFILSWFTEKQPNNIYCMDVIRKFIIVLADVLLFILTTMKENLENEFMFLGFVYNKL